MDEQKIIAAMQEGFERIDALFAKVDARFERVDAQFDEVREQFREVRMNAERLENEMKLWNMKIDVLGGRINRLMDEVKLPSGAVGQRFAEMRPVIADGDHQTRILIENLDSKVQAMGEQVDVVNEKLDRFRATVDGTR